MAYDEKCWDLAEAFILDEPILKDKPPEEVKALCDELAQDIQNCIEDFLEYKSSPEEQADPAPDGPTDDAP